MNIIKIKNLIHDYNAGTNDQKRAINDVSININEGDFVAIIGHNGSGKSSLAKHLNGMLLPTSGSVWVDDIDTTDRELMFQVRQTAGLVFQNPDDQIVSSVVEEDVAFGPENLAVETSEIRARVKKALEAVRMYKFRKKAPIRLSGGQKQRVAIAGIIAMNPKCIILDEPTSMLDPIGRKEVIETIKELNVKYGITIIIITHHMEEAAIADYIYVMDHGRIKMDGVPKVIFTKVDELKKLGLEVPKVTELAYELNKAGLNINSDILSADVLVDEIKRVWKEQRAE